MSSDLSDLIRVTLLGTGCPIPTLDRLGPSTLVEAGGLRLLFDCGRGTMQRVYQIDRTQENFDKLFLTHLHSDHITGILDLWVTGFLYNRFTNPLHIWGPKGTKEMIQHLEKAFKVDLKSKRTFKPNTGLEIKTIEIDEGYVYKENGVNVTPFRVPHWGQVEEPCFGYRVDYAGKSVVVSGDTQFSENLVQFSENVDLLIHEVAAVPLVDDIVDRFNRVLTVHTSPEEAGKIFSLVKPKLGVFSHIVQLHGVSLDEMLKRTKSVYNGPVRMGEDLMSFEVTDSGIKQVNNP